MGYLIAQCFRLAASVLQACRALFLRVLPTSAKSAKVPIFHITDDALCSYVLSFLDCQDLYNVTQTVPRLRSVITLPPCFEIRW